MTSLDLCATGRGRRRTLTELKLVQYSMILVTILLVFSLNLAAGLTGLRRGGVR